MKKYIINVFHEYVERIEVDAENAETAKELAIEQALLADGTDRDLEYLETTDAEVKSVDGVPTYGCDEPDVK